jgi:hypothetical protein
MSTQPIEQPGQTLEKSLAELLDVREESDIVIEWGEQIRGIEKSERSAENEGASVRIR